MIWTTAFWKGATERAVKTIFQTLAALIAVSAGTELIPAVGIDGLPWLAILSASALAGALSLATSLGNADFTAGEPKLTETEKVARVEYLDSLTAEKH